MNVSAWFFRNTVNFVDFSIIYVSQGSDIYQHLWSHNCTILLSSQGSDIRYHVWWNVYIVLHSKFPAESVSKRIFKIGQDLTKLLPKVWWLPFWNTVYMYSILIFIVTAGCDVEYIMYAQSLSSCLLCSWDFQLLIC